MMTRGASGLDLKRPEGDQIQPPRFGLSVMTSKVFLDQVVLHPVSTDRTCFSVRMTNSYG